MPRAAAAYRVAGLLRRSIGAVAACAIVAGGCSVAPELVVRRVAQPGAETSQAPQASRARRAPYAPRAPQATCAVRSGERDLIVGSGVPGDPALPEPSTGFRVGLTAVPAASYMIVTANPLATKAGCTILRDGGTAADAAIAVQAVLGLVEPQSSGLGGGAFVVHYEAATRQVQTYDGRETAPAAATENALRWIDDTRRTLPSPDPRTSGRSIGTPGVLRMLELLHQGHGRQAWATLFDPAITLARDGFAIGGRMAQAIAGARSNLLRDPDAVAYFLQDDGNAPAVGTRLVNPAYARTLESVAAEGADAFYRGAIAQDIVAEVARSQAGPDAPDALGPMTPGLLSLSDLAGYQARIRPPVCSDYRAYRICGMGPPSSGGITVAQVMRMLAHFDLATLTPSQPERDGGRPQAQAIHLISEAERLAYADRDRYVADSDFVALPGGRIDALLDADYLAARAASIDPDRSMGTASAGVFAVRPGGVHATEGQGTSHFSIVDSYGNALAMTTSIEGGMGAFRFVRGFLLNNQLTDFSFEPTGADGPIANRLQAGKRPRSSMAPTLVFHRTAEGELGDLVLVTGSPGGSAIIQFVVKTLVAMLDWGLDAQQASGLVNFGAANGPVTHLGGEHPLIEAPGTGKEDPLVTALRAIGHEVRLDALPSGLATIRVRADAPLVGARDNGGTERARAGPGRLEGGVDPRREGLALGG